jgi:hypothetical protein
MVSREEIEHYLDRLSADGTTYRDVEPGLWLIHPASAIGFDVVCHYNPPVVVLRVNVMELPADDVSCNGLARRLLQLNASDLIHGSYGIEQDTVVLTEALELSHLDFEEFLAAYESMTLALAAHLRELSTYREAR